MDLDSQIPKYEISLVHWRGWNSASSVRTLGSMGGIFDLLQLIFWPEKEANSLIIRRT